MWNSVWLGTDTLVSFTALFIAMLLATVLLFCLSQARRGFPVEGTSTTSQYGWQYGPTAVLTVVLALWTQVDSANKILMPWKELRMGPAAPSKSILVEYMTPDTVTAVWKAVHQRHWPVAVSIIGTLLIQVATIFSTGLFDLEPTITHSNGVPLTIANAFDGRDFYLTNTSSNINSDPTILYYGVRFQGLSSSTGVDVDRGLVVPGFEPRDKARSSNATTYTSTVDGAQAHLDCEYRTNINATSANLPWWSVLGTFWVLNITTPSCNITNVIVAEGPEHNYYRQKNATQAYEGYFADYICDPRIDYSFFEQPSPSNSSVEHRIVMTMADLRFSPHNSSLTQPATLYLNNLTVAICKASYSIGQYETSYTGNSARVKSMETTPVSSVSSTISEIPGFSAKDLGAAVQRSLERTYLGPGGQDWVLSQEVSTFYQILSALNGNVSIGEFMDPQRLISSGTEAFNGLASQLIHTYKMKPSNTTAEGSSTRQEDRLWARTLSVAFMCTSFGLLAGLSLLLLLIRPWDVAPCDPAPISTTASVLASSPQVRSLLSGLGAARSKQIRQRVSPFAFQSRVTEEKEVPSFIVEPIGDSAAEELFRPPTTSLPQKWWAPASVTWWFQALAVGAPLAFVAVLETVQRKSDRDSGFVDVNSHAFANTHALATCILAPWMALQRGNAPASRSLTLNLTSRLVPHRLYLSLKTASVVSAWLPVAVSGLYIVVDMNNLFYSDGNAGTIISLWTYDDLVFNTMQTQDFEVGNVSPGTQIPLSATLQAVRPSLNCTVVPQEWTRPVWDEWSNTQVTDGKVVMVLNTTVPSMCEKKLQPNISAFYWAQTFELPKDSTPAYFGHTSVLSWSPNGGLKGNGPINTDVNLPEAYTYDSDGVTDDVVGGWGCPSLAVTVGRGSATEHKSRKGNMTSTSYEYDVDVTTVMCFQNFETVAVHTSLQIPSLGVMDARAPPVPDESTARYLANDLPHVANSTVFEFAANTPLLTLTSATGAPGGNRTTTVLSPDGGPLARPQRRRRLRDLPRHVHRRVAAAHILPRRPVPSWPPRAACLRGTWRGQALSSAMRRSTGDDDDDDDEDAASTVDTVRVPGRRRLRLRQQRGPKTALQAMQAPCSFAGAAPRLAEGELCSRGIVHVGAEWWWWWWRRQKEGGRGGGGGNRGSLTTRRSSSVFDGWRFSLGWWESWGRVEAFCGCWPR
ncbi:hypothetical protein F4780DRAFT_768214 [Xylariomycetidae sp. FL0641]|nr:hypothetical protein F4780DRAFT_768214 [Xylariomycetidae sp. FL0641]